MTATPQRQQRVFKELDNARGGRFKPILRMIKHWKIVHSSVGLRSYHLETLAYEIFKQKPITDYREALRTSSTKPPAPSSATGMIQAGAATA
jgi:hypothetical protein